MIRVRDFHPLRSNFPDGSTSLASCHVPVLQPRNCRNSYGLGFSRFARHYSGNHFCFLLLWVLRCFSSPRLPTVYSVTDSSSAGLPHSEIHGSKDICSSPWLIAAYHVLLRLQEPRHPPCALAYFFVNLNLTLYLHTEPRFDIYTFLLYINLLLLLFFTSCQRSLSLIDDKHSRLS